MSVAKITEITAQSPEGFEQAIKEGLARAAKTLEHIQSAWVKTQEVVVRDGKIDNYRVGLKITFVLEE